MLIRHGFIMIAAWCSLNSSQSLARGFFGGYSPQGRKFLDICENRGHPSHDSKKIVAKMMDLVRSTDCRDAWERIKKLKDFDFSNLLLHDISALQVIKHAESINLERNFINDLKVLGSIQGLKKLNLDNNCLHTLESLAVISTLKRISLENNELAGIPSARLFNRFPGGISVNIDNQHDFKPTCHPGVSHLPPRAIALYSQQNPNHLRINTIPLAPLAPAPIRQAWTRSNNTHPSTMRSGSNYQTSRENPSTFHEAQNSDYSTSSLENTIPTHLHADSHNQSSSEESSQAASASSAKKLSPEAFATLVAQQLKKISARGVTFKSVIMLDDVDSLDALKTAFGELGLINISEDEFLQYLYQVSGLLDELAEINVAPCVPEPRGPKPPTLRVSGRAMSKKVEARTYRERLEELRREQGIQHDVDSFYIPFFTLMTEKKLRLENATYPGGEQLDFRKKYYDLLLLLAAIKQVNTGSSQRRQLNYHLYVPYPETFDSSGQSAEWYDELRYKLYKLYQRYPHLTADQQSDLISLFLHGGRHCNDAKWHAINDAFRRFCPEDAQRIENEYGSKGNGRDLGAIVNNSLAKLKVKALTSYIDHHIELANKKHEYCSYFNATWDKLGPLLGLEKVDSNYNMVLHNAVRDFDAFYREKFSADAVVKATDEDIKNYIKKYYFGPLAQLTTNLDPLVIDILRYYKILV